MNRVLDALLSTLQFAISALGVILILGGVMSDDIDQTILGVLCFIWVRLGVAVIHNDHPTHLERRIDRAWQKYYLTGDTEWARTVDTLIHEACKDRTIARRRVS